MGNESRAGQMSDQDIEKYTRQFHDFIENFDSVQLATVDHEAEPEASYAPCLEIDGNFYVYLSELSKHTMNLLDNAKVSMLFIEDEARTANPFARRRASYRARAIEIMRDSGEFASVLDAFEQKFGNFMTMLRMLTDFHLFRLEPQEGIYVAGFGRAFELCGQQLGQLQHVNPEKSKGDKAGN
jgi:putative heme iron utilization protein